MKHILLLAFTYVLLLQFCLPNVATTQNHSYYSPLLQREAEYLVFLPQDYTPKKQRYPVLYLLHCAGCTHDSYIELYPLLKIRDSLNFIIVIPFDGTTKGWWLDSPIDPLSQLSRWLSGEFKMHIDSQYATLPDRNNTGIAGHSMGGYGALLNYINHYDTYGYVFSAKGLLDIIAHEGAFGVTTVLAEYTSDPEPYESVDLFRLVQNIQGKETRIRFYSGPNDWFTAENRHFDTLLTSLKIEHFYDENEEPHQSMSLQSIWKMYRFFDSSFTRTQVE